MKELSDILHAFDRLPEDTDAALATVVRVEGSAYRAPGARMLITGDGRLIGQISGGCLERDVVARAGGVMSSKSPILVRYDTSNDPENGTAFSLGCGGAIDILIEPLKTLAGSELVRWMTASQTDRVLIVTVISKQHPSMLLGQRMMIDASHAVTGSIGNTRLRERIVEMAIPFLHGDCSAPVRLQTAEENVELFIDLLKPATELLIFGAGNDAIPLIDFGRALGWKVRVVDVGSAPPDLGRTWKADEFIRCRLDQVEQQVPIRGETAAVIMTHNYGHDRQLIRWLSTQPLRYLGMLGPRHRTDEILGDLKPLVLRAPVGLDIGAETPEEVALSIVAEINAVLRDKTGLPLSSRNGPIHTR